MENNIKIFYSWQSDLLDSTNKKAIREIITKAKTKIEVEINQGNIVIEEAASREVGSPNIPVTILNQISESDIFICDVSIVNKDDKKNRKMPNPNVMYELGFAVAKLGWERVILFFNEAYGEVKELPFDIDRHRVARYSLSDQNLPNTNNIVLQSSQSLCDSIKGILSKDPLKPCMHKKISNDDIKRERDIKNIKDFFASIHLGVIDKFIEEIPSCIDNDIFYFFDNLHAIATSSHFYMYDRDLYDEFVKFYTAWDETLRHDNQYNPNLDHTLHIWHNPGDMPFNTENQKIWDTICHARNTMRASLNTILDIIRTKYIEIDIEAINKESFQRLLNYKKAMT